MHSLLCNTIVGFSFDRTLASNSKLNSFDLYSFAI